MYAGGADCHDFLIRLLTLTMISMMQSSGGILKPEDCRRNIKASRHYNTKPTGYNGSQCDHQQNGTAQDPDVEEIEEAMSGLRKFLFEHVYLN